jgi:pSer/pThr/pTyr-binding forkhead associated (FHA) protein
MATNPKLIVLSEQMRGQVFDLTGDEYSIGRSENATICIPDPTISGLHAKLVRVGDGEYDAEDAGSTNGTRVNGIRISSQRMVNSDILQLGGVELMFDCDDQSVSTVLGTNTNIDLASTAGGIPIEEMANFDSSKKRKSENPMARMVITGIIAVLGIAAVILAVVLAMRMFGA